MLLRTVELFVVVLHCIAFERLSAVPTFDAEREVPVACLFDMFFVHLPLGLVRSSTAPGRRHFLDVGSLHFISKTCGKSKREWGKSYHFFDRNLYQNTLI